MTSRPGACARPRPQTDSLKFSRRNEEVKPFEAGGESALEQHGARGNCSLFALGSHTKKRPNNLVLGRLYDFRCGRAGARRRAAGGALPCPALLCPCVASAARVG